MKFLHGQSASVVIGDRARPGGLPAACANAFASRDERPEIEGLRGLAILSLLAIHCVPDLSRGGAIGTDIFFVVSGYLLARRVSHRGAVSLDWSSFFARRLQRAVPALVAVLVGCLAFATLFTLPKDLMTVGRSLAWGASFMTNLDAWRRGVPIDAAQNLDPLWHLWQAAAIAQSCLLLAFLAWAMRRHPRIWLAMIITTGLASLAFNLVRVADYPAAAFYLLPGRWWEFTAGVVGLALMANSGHRPADPALDAGARSTGHSGAAWPAVAPLMGWLGVACFAMAALLAGDTTHFPGSWALWPVAGTVCLLAAGPHDWVNRHVFAHPVLRFYGRVSYPLFLWHWPLLCFPLLLGVPLSVDVRVLILIASVVLAALTHELIEKPVAALQPTRRLSGLLLASLGVCVALGATVVATDGLRFTFPAELQSFAAPRPPGAH
jgi:peptidoglycan/LPS O-acetylase OafA/YrhL